MKNPRGLRVWPGPGTVVRLTGYFLKSTGQQLGNEGLKRWKVVDNCGFPNCPCRRMVAGESTGSRSHGPSFYLVPVDEPLPRERYEDIISTRDDGQFMRHVNAANLEIVGGKPQAADYP